MKVFDATLVLEAKDLTHLGRKWGYLAGKAKVCFPSQCSMAFVSEAPVNLEWSGPRGSVVLLHAVRIEVAEVPLTVWIELPSPVRLESDQPVRLEMPQVVRTDGPFPNVETTL